MLAIQLFNDSGCLLDSVPVEYQSGDDSAEIGTAIRMALESTDWVFHPGDTIKIVDRS